MIYKTVTEKAGDGLSSLEWAAIPEVYADIVFNLHKVGDEGAWKEVMSIPIDYRFLDFLLEMKKMYTRHCEKFREVVRLLTGI